MEGGRPEKIAGGGALLASLIDPGVRTLAYLRGLTIWSYLVLFSLVLGAWAHQQQRRA